jgi:hypothetical protein
MKKIFALITCIIAWLGSILQYYLVVTNASSHNQTALVATSRFFGYFTVLTNLLVAICLTFLLFTRGKGHRFFSRFSVQTAITVYILIVGLGYNILLRHLYHMEGLQAVANEIQHVVVPALFTLYWIFCLRKKRLSWISLLPWLLYPFLFLVMALLRGSVDGFYPYPFLNVDDLGLSVVLRNSFGLLFIFIIVSLIFIAVSRRRLR